MLRQVLLSCAVAGLLLTGCGRQTVVSPGFDDTGINRPARGSGNLFVSVTFEQPEEPLPDVDNQYRVSTHVVGHLVSQVTFTLTGPNLREPRAVTLYQVDWTNADGTYKPIQASFANVVAGPTTVSITGLASDGSRVIEGSSQVSVGAGLTAVAAITARFVTGSTGGSLDPNAPTP